MSFPPELTWLELLPKGVHCTCEAAPDAVRALIAKHAGASGGADAIVAFNDASAAERFAQAGHTYVRRLAILPSLDHPRWLVPLDAGGAVAAAGLSLYTPARRSAHLKKFAVGLAARSGLKFWCRDTVTIACREI